MRAIGASTLEFQVRVAIGMRLIVNRAIPRARHALAMPPSASLPCIVLAARKSALYSAFFRCCHAVRLPAQFNFAQHLLDVNASRAAKLAYRDDEHTLTYGELEDARAPIRRHALGARHPPRRARAAADARHDRLAGGISWLLVRGSRSGGFEHAADTSRLRLHAGAQPCAGGICLECIGTRVESRR